METVEIVHRFTPEVAELKDYVTFPVELTVLTTRVHGGVLEITYGLTSAMQSTLEIHRRLRGRRKVQSEIPTQEETPGGHLDTSEPTSNKA